MDTAKIVMGRIVNLGVPRAGIVVFPVEEPVKIRSEVLDETSAIEQRLNALKKQTGKTKFDLSEIIFGYA